MRRTTTRWRRRQSAALYCLLAACSLVSCVRRDEPAAPPADDPKGPQFSPFTFLQAGDPQIGGWTSIEETKGRLVQLAHAANRLRPAAVIVVGDLVDGGPDEKELAAFDEARGEFRVPVWLIPGNHDDPAAYRRRYGRDHYSFTLHNCEFVCINSNRLVGRLFSSQQRAEAEDELQWLAQALARARRENRTHIFGVMHHPPATLPATAVRLDSLFRQYGVRVILSGHIHRTEEITYRGYTTFTVAGTAKAADAKGFGYRLFRVYEDRVEQEYIRLDTAPATTQPTPRGAAIHALSNTTAVP